ncbi:MAG: tyrosine-type recombinase/integrase [Acidimicrobiales bacterium]
MTIASDEELHALDASRATPATGSELLSGFPPRPVARSWPETEVPRSKMVNRLLAEPFALAHPLSQRTRRIGVLAVVSWLQARPGDTWQERWLASGAESQADWRTLVDAPEGEPEPGTLRRTRSLLHLAPGLLVLICADVIRPSLAFLLASAPTRYKLAQEMARTRDAIGFERLAQCLGEGAVGLQPAQQALTRIAVIMAAKGGLSGEVTVGDCVEVLELTRQMGGDAEGHARSSLFYQALRQSGTLGEDAPAALRVFSGRGQPNCAQLVDRYKIACTPMRDVLVDYLSERQSALDFSSLQNLAYLLGKLFWKDLEVHHPGIASLKLPRDMAAAWKQRVMTRTKTTVGAHGEALTETVARLDGRSVLSAVRCFYLDVAEWADDDPVRWGPWAVRCPVSASDVSHKKDRSRRKSRMDQRTRERLPVLPSFVRFVETERRRAGALLAAAEGTEPGSTFSATGETLRRRAMRTKTTGAVWAEDPDGARRNLSFQEHRAFWAWAMVEVLRHTGIRIEELTELSHHSLIQYRLPGTGELVPLLQIAPSKTDTERLLVVSPELADVLSAIIARVRDEEGRVPLVVSYDRNERVYNAPMPLLFQCRRQLEDVPVADGALRGYLDDAMAKMGVMGPDGRTLHYTFHDFRRMFITDAILHGMPPHIAQLIAGHRDINTTMGYKAVYPEEVIGGHRAFISRRRALRPSEEYRTPSDEEWEEFLGHFARRKVALGDCGRSYATPCIHEHSCLRCPLLRPDPQERSRFVEIRDNLIARIGEAESNGWLGEAEGLQVSLAGAREKLAQVDEIVERRAVAVNLGIPTFSHVASRTITDSRDATTR